MVNGFHSKESVTLIYFLPLSVHLTCASAFQVFDAFQVADAGFENETRSMSNVIESIDVNEMPVAVVGIGFHI